MEKTKSQKEESGNTARHREGPEKPFHTFKSSMCCLSIHKCIHFRCSRPLSSLPLKILLDMTFLALVIAPLTLKTLQKRTFLEISMVIFEFLDIKSILYQIFMGTGLQLRNQMQGRHRVKKLTISSVARFGNVTQLPYTL